MHSSPCCTWSHPCNQTSCLNKCVTTKISIIKKWTTSMKWLSSILSHSRSIKCWWKKLKGSSKLMLSCKKGWRSRNKSILQSWVILKCSIISFWLRRITKRELWKTLFRKKIIRFSSSTKISISRPKIYKPTAKTFKNNSISTKVPFLPPKSISKNL